MKECVQFTTEKTGAVQCHACSHECTITDGSVGICGIRKNESGKLYLLPYGRTIALHIDPIEKKPLFHFLPGSSAYSFGTVGCNFRCGNCQNYDISQIFERKGKVKEYNQLPLGTPASPEQIVQQAQENNCDSIAYTYNEPTIFLEYALDTMKLAHKEGLKNVWVSNGFMTESTLDLIVPYLDAINIDIKSFEDAFYRSNCGARIQPVLDNCKRLAKEDSVWLETTTLIIPTKSDHPDMLEQIAEFISTELGEYVPWHISVFSGAISWKLQSLPETPIETIERAYYIGKNAGLQHVFAGNVHGSEWEHTYCPACGEVVVQRIGYHIERFDTGGTCACGEQLLGLWNNK